MLPLLGIVPGELVAVEQCHQFHCQHHHAADHQSAMVVSVRLIWVSDYEIGPVHVNTSRPLNPNNSNRMQGTRAYPSSLWGREGRQGQVPLWVVGPRERSIPSLKFSEPMN